VNTALVFFAAFVPFGQKLTPVGPVYDHVYFRLDSPPSSEPSTVRFVDDPVTGFGFAAAGVATIGGASVTATDAVPLMLPAAARTVYEPAVIGAV
jgi:hypothetical protein